MVRSSSRQIRGRLWAGLGERPESPPPEGPQGAPKPTSPGRRFVFRRTNGGDGVDPNSCKNSKNWSITEPFLFIQQISEIQIRSERLVRSTATTEKTWLIQFQEVRRCQLRPRKVPRKRIKGKVPLRPRCAGASSRFVLPRRVLTCSHAQDYGLRHALPSRPPPLPVLAPGSRG